jgi:WD40 repeat protein
MRPALPVAVVALVLMNGSLEAAPPEYQLVLQAPPTTAVGSVAVSRDGALVASASGEGGVRLYDAKTGSLLRAIGGAGDRSVVFSPDGKSLTAAGFHMDKLVSLWDVASGKRLRTFTGQTEWEADATAISPDGKMLASSATDKQILVWDIATGKLLHQLKDQPYRVSALAFSPDSTTLAGGGGDRRVHLWNCSTGKLRRTLEGHRDWICTIAFSPDGQTIASGSCDWGFHRGYDWPRPASRGAEQCEWRLWDVASGRLQRTVADSGRLLSLSIAPDGKSLACGIGEELRLYDLSSDAPGKIVTRHDADVTTVAFSPDGRAIISGSHDQTIKRTRVVNSETDWEALGSWEQVNSVALSDDASLLATGSSDQRFARGRLPAGAKHVGPGAVRLWDARTGRLLHRLGNRAEQVMAVALSADGRHIAGAGLEGGKGVAHVWDTQTGAPLWSTDDHAKEVLAIAFSPDGTALATASADGVLKLRNSATGRVTRTWEGHQDGGTSLAFSRDGKTLFCGEGAGGTRIWDTSTGRSLQILKTPRPKSELFTIDRLMNSINLSRDGAVLATCGSSINNEFVDSVRLWDAQTGALQRDFAAEKIHGRPMALSPDGSIVATGGKAVQLWDVRTGKPLRKLVGHLKRTQSFAFSSDGRLIFSGGSYGTTNVWEVATGRLMVTLFAFPGSDRGATTDDWLAYHPDGFYDGSPGVERYLAWRFGDELLTPQSLGERFHRPERIKASLQVEISSTSAP